MLHCGMRLIELLSVVKQLISFSLSLFLLHSYQSSAVSYAKAFAANTSRVKRFLKEELLVQLQKSPPDGVLSLSLPNDVRKHYVRALEDMEDGLKAFEVWQKAMEHRTATGATQPIGFDFVTVQLMDFIAHVRQELSRTK